MSVGQSIIHTGTHHTPLGDVVVSTEGQKITGLWFVGQRYFMEGIGNHVDSSLPILDRAYEWLDMYFDGLIPPQIPYGLPESTPFRNAVWREMEKIPYGGTVTYGDIAISLSRQWGRPVSARAVGGAVSHNPISLIVPCHRVVGSKGMLTGYSGGLDRKAELLRLEGALSDAPSLDR